MGTWDMENGDAPTQYVTFPPWLHPCTGLKQQVGSIGRFWPTLCSDETVLYGLLLLSDIWEVPGQEGLTLSLKILALKLELLSQPALLEAC